MGVWDSRLLLWINQHHHPVLDAILYPISASGELGVLAVLMVLAFFGGRPLRHWKAILTLGLFLVLVDRIVFLGMGHFLFRERPYLALEGIRQMGFPWETSSFPSGHAHSATLVTLVLGVRNPRWLYPLLPYTLLTFYSRPYLGMHYPLDILAGCVTGLAIGALVLRLTGRQKERLEAREPEAHPERAAIRS